MPALDHATTFERRIAALEALVARLVERDAIDAADIATALRETVDGLTRQWPMAGGGETWAPTYGDLLAALDRTAEIRRARNGAADRGTT